jgi:predicted metal-dependent phosphoesterase TrpH
LEPHVPTITLQADDAIDLQMHTIYSDGQWQPEQLLDYLASHGFRAVAITDHDHVDHTSELIALGAARHVHVIPAVEVTTEWEGRPVDVLCFAPTLIGGALAELARDTERRQMENTRAVHDELRRRGYTFPQQATALGEQGGALRRPIDNATLLLAHGHVASLFDGLEVIRGAGYRSIAAEIGDAVAAAHASGTVALIAHPGRRDSGFTTFDLALLDAVRERFPLDGIEVRHPTHTADQVAAFEQYTRAHGWLASAGSDSHGPPGALPIAYPARLARELLERCGVRIVE